MKNMNKYILLGMVLAVVLIIGGIYIGLKTEPVEGSVTVGNEYMSTSTKQALVGTQLTNLTVLKSGAGTLGSVVITGAGTGVLNFYDATTSNATARTNTATTTIATFPASAGAGTYTFDVTFRDGLLVELGTSAPTSTITWRQ